MNAVVLEIRGNMAAVMTADGQIIKIEDCGYRVGEEINVAVKSSRKKTSHITAMKPLLIAASALFVLFGGGAGAYFVPAGTVSLDVNPSIEYKINMFDRVLSVSGVNDDGEAVITSLERSDIVGQSIENAVENTIDEIRTEGYFSEEENYVVVTANAQMGKDSEKLTKKLSDKIDEHEDLSPIVGSVSRDDFEKAHSEGTTPGKIMVVDMLEEAAGEEIDRDTWMHSSVNNIMHEYNRRIGMEGPEVSGMPDSDSEPSEPNGENQPDEALTRPEDGNATDDMEAPQGMENPENGEQNGNMPNLGGNGPSGDGEVPGGAAGMAPGGNGAAGNAGVPDGGGTGPGGQTMPEGENNNGQMAPGGGQMPDGMTKPNGGQMAPGQIQ